MEIDNFDILMKHMDFIDVNDRYIVHVMRRPKDCKALANQLGASEAQRLIRTYYIDNLDYLKAKIPAIKELCRSCNARAYLIAAPKDNFDCLMNLGQKILETIRNKNYSVKPEHLLRQAYCENHKSRKKQWIIDLDNDEMHGWTKDEVIALIKAIIHEDCKHGEEEAEKICNEIYDVPTRNGFHIITPPFNLQKALKKCAMLYEGAKKGNELQDLLDQLVLTDTKELAKADWATHKLHPFNGSEWLSNKFSEDDHLFRMRKALESKLHDIPGWLHKDGMTILFCP